MLTEGKDYCFNTNKLSVKNNNRWVDINLPKYNMISLIAAGANGVTVKAKHKLTDRNVAIKVWKPRNSNTFKYKEQFYGEVKKIARLSHPSIVTIHDAEVLDSGFCMAVYDFIEGITLKKWLDIPHPNEQYINVGRKIFQAVLYYQSMNLLHGDLHENNILVTTNEDICIIDFGTSGFAAPGKNREREIYFTMNLMDSIFRRDRHYNCNHFILIVLKNNTIVRIKDKPLCSLEVVPKLLTQTMLNYINVLELMSYVNEYTQRDIVELCGFVGKTYYLDIMEYVSYMLKNKIKDKMSRYFIAAIQEHTAESVFPIVSDDYKQSKLTYHASIIAYCELAKKVSLPVSPPSEIINKTGDYATHSSAQTGNIVVEWLNRWIRESGKSYFEISDELRVRTGLEDSSIFEIVRETLYFSLKKYFYNDIALHYWIAARIHEIFCNPTLIKLAKKTMVSHDKIDKS